LTQNRRSTQNSGCSAWLAKLFGQKTAKNKPGDVRIENLPADPEPLPYRIRDDFLSPAEKSFYHVIKGMMGSTFTICAKVSLADIFFVIRPNENMSAYNRINRKHVDFLICESREMKPLFAIELDDSSHNRSDRIERDAFVDEVFETAELPLIHIPVRASYNTNELGYIFKKALEQSGFLSNPNPRDNNEQQQTTQKDSKPAEEPKNSPSSAPICPKCGTPMILRIAKNGNQPGRKFYGCSNYPKCRMIIPVDEGN